jgi:hypothetical protein
VAAGTALTLAFGGIALADNIQDSIESATVGLTLVAGSDAGGTASIRVVGNNADGTATDPGCNWDTGESALKLDVITPVGVTASPDPLQITECGVFIPVTFKAGASAVSGVVTVSIVAVPAGGGGYNNQVSIPITVNPPANTKPVVTLNGVTNGASYEIGSVPTATCEVTDPEDGPSSFAADLSGTLSHGLGSQTATCDYTDLGGLAADTVSATYTVVDTIDPTITGTIAPTGPDGTNGWYTSNPTVTFTCADSGSGINTCVVDGQTTASRTLGEGADQSVSGTATDWAANTAAATVGNIDVDLTNPTATFDGSLGGPIYFGSVPSAPTCTAADLLSGPNGCDVTGYSTAVGTHTLTATASDKAGRTGTSTLQYTVLPWTLKGFYSPVDMGGVWNSVKGGSTVPLKFEVFAASELTSTSVVKTFVQTQVTCATSTTVDEIEIVSTGGTILRYDATGGQFIQNWQTPKKPGACYKVTLATQDGGALSANFLLK